MKRNIRTVFAGWGILLAMILPVQILQAQTTTVYFVGNSFTSTYDVPGTFKSLAASGGHAVSTGSDIIGGSELAQHWATGVATNAIANGNYDYVVLQEGSTVAYDSAIEANFNIYAPLYNEVITNSGAQTMLYMTWVREDQLATLTNGIAIYRAMAAQLGCEISPVGEAWRRVMEQKPSLDLFSADRHHPNPEGVYLSACNFYGAIFNESPEGLSMRTVGGLTLDAADAALLQRIAWDAVQFVSYTNPPVITSLTVDQAVRTNNVPFTFSATATDNGSITDYLWDFGDGTTTNGAALSTVSHMYATDGIFPVTVKVTDNSGETERTGLYATLDTTGPQIFSITATRTMLTVRFNQDIQQASAETAANYTISGGISVISATQTAGNTVRLEVSTLPAGVEYTLTVNNILSALGTQIFPDTTGTFMYVDGSNMHLRFDFGSTNYLTDGSWNNIPYGGGDLVITNAIDIYGVERNIGLRRTPAVAVTYAGVSSGTIASNLYPASAQRDCVYSTRAFSYQIEGADPAAEYRFTFFASKLAATRETLFTIGTNSVMLDCAYNSNRVAVIEGVKADIDGNILFTVDTNSVNSSGFCYLSVLEIEDTSAEAATRIEGSVSTLDITEGTTNSFNLRLGGQPSGITTVSVNRVSGEAHLQVLAGSSFLYFDTNNWNQWQTVYIEALSDVDSVSGVATVECADLSGTYSATTVTVTQIDTTLTAPAAGFSAFPVSGKFPLPVTFTDTSSGSITNRFWDFGDGVTTNTMETSLSHTYTSAGTRTVMLIVDGPVGISTNTQVDLISVTAPVPPSAGFSASTTSGTAPLPVSFTDTSTGDITNRFWDFGDGATTNTLLTSISHTYSATGVYSVALTASGPAGSDTRTQADLITVSEPAAGNRIQLDISGSYNYDAFVTGEEISYAATQAKTVPNTIGDNTVSYNYTTTQYSHLVDPNAPTYNGIAADGIVAGGAYELAKGVTPKFGTASGNTKVNNCVARLYDNSSLSFSATINLAAGDQKKYSDFNILVNGNRYGTLAGTMSATLSVKYVGDATWYTVWAESVSTGNGGVFGGGYNGDTGANSKQSSAWRQIAVSDGEGFAKTVGGLTVGGSGSSYMYEFVTPVTLDSTKVLESFKMDTTTYNKSRVNDFLLYAASATAVSSSVGGGTPPPPPAVSGNGSFGKGQDVISWTTVQGSGYVYSVWYSTNLLSGFQPLETNLPDTVQSVTNTISASPVFYQIRAQ